MMLKVKYFLYYKGMGVIFGRDAPFTAKFLGWTSAEGITYCSCSNGKRLRIPAMALVDFDVEAHPVPGKSNE